MEALRDNLQFEEPLLEVAAKSQAPYWRLESLHLHLRNISYAAGSTTVSFTSLCYTAVTQCFEELAYYGIQFNLVTFLKTVLHENNVTAARNYTNWQGTCYIASLIGAVIADSYLGRYLTTLAFFTVYLIGMATMSISASFSACAGPDCLQEGLSMSVVFFVGLYMMAIGAGGIKPCVSSFGADEFDDSIPAERLKKDSFFNWPLDPDSVHCIGRRSLLVGSGSYRVQKPQGKPILRVFQVIVAATRKWNVGLPDNDVLLYESPEKKASMADGSTLQHTPVLRFLDKAAVISSPEELSAGPDPWRLCTVTQVEELKAIIGMLPIWATGIVFFAVLAQFSSTFLEQGRTMDTQVGTFAIPPASLASFDAISVVVWVPVYDRVLVPAARRLTGNERVLSELQRFGAGLLLSVLVMATAALVETRRLAVDAAAERVAPTMSILWQVPQYLLVGASVVFACVGQSEFFYNEAPPSMRSLCSALALLTVALGSYLSSLVVTVGACLTATGGEPGWIPDYLNQGHLDRFFWLLAALSTLNLAVFVCCARRYSRKKTLPGFSG
ncbi:hypothetical protein EJB05_05656, partial [Eragrostis curvula]